MKAPQEIVAALADNPPTAELLSGLAPEVQENIKRGWLNVLEESLATESTPPPADPSAQPAPGPTLVVDESPAQNAAAVASPAPEQAQS